MAKKGNIVKKTGGLNGNRALDQKQQGEIAWGVTISPAARSGRCEKQWNYEILWLGREKKRGGL